VFFRKVFFLPHLSSGAAGYMHFLKASFPRLSSSAGFWEILAPSIQWEIAPSIWVGVWCACDLGASLEVSFHLGFRILLRSPISQSFCSPISQSLFFSISQSLGFCYLLYLLLCNCPLNIINNQLAGYQWHALLEDMRLRH